MAKIQAYKFINPSGVKGQVTPTIAAARKTLYATNRLGATITSVGKVVSDIEAINIASMKNEQDQEKAERRRLRRQKDTENEELLGIAALKKKKKGNVSKSMITAGMKAVPGLKWVSAFVGPAMAFLIELGSWALMKELLEWAADESSKKKIATFLCKLRFVVEKFQSFGNWLFREKLVGGRNKLLGKDRTFGERVSGLGDLLQGIGVLTLLTNPLGSLSWILTSIGWFVKNIQDFWNNFNPFRTKTKTPGGGLPKTPSGKNFKTSKITGRLKGGPKSQQGIIPTIKNFGKNVGQKFKFPGYDFIEGPKGKGKFDASFGRAPTIPKPGTGVKKLTGFKGLLSKAKNLTSKIKVPGFISKTKSLFGPATTTVFAGLELGERISEGQSTEKAITGTVAETVGGLSGFTAAANMTLPLTGPMMAAPEPLTTIAGGIMYFGAGLAGSFGGSTIAGGISDKAFDAKEDNKKDTKWWNPFSWGKKKAGGGPLKGYFLGGIIKGIGKAVSGVVSGVGKAVSGVVSGIGKVVSNPLVQTVASFIPGVGPIIGGINAVTQLMNGNPMGALMSGVGALGQFANINTVNAISQPQWMQNLRFSGFGQGVANAYHSIGGAWTNLMGSNIGKLGKGIFEGVSTGNWGGALSGFADMTGLGNVLQNVGDFTQKWGLGGIGNMIPGLSSTIANIPGLAGMPGISDLFGGSFNPLSVVSTLSDRFGLSGIYDAVTGMMQSGDMMTGLRQLAPELGVDPAILGVYDEGRQYFTNGKFNAQLAMQNAIEFVPVPLILKEAIVAPAPVGINSGGGGMSLSSLVGRTR